MPTVIRQSGFSIMIYTDDHEPMHVHAWYQENYAIIEFENDVFLKENRGLNRSQVKRAIEIVNEHRDLLIESWRGIYG